MPCDLCFRIELVYFRPVNCRLESLSMHDTPHCRDGNQRSYDRHSFLEMRSHRAMLSQQDPARELPRPLIKQETPWQP